MSRQRLGLSSRFQYETNFKNVGCQSAAAPDTTSILYNKRFSPVTRKRQRGSDPELHHCTTKLDLILLFFCGEAALDYKTKHVVEIEAQAVKLPSAIRILIFY